MARIDDNVAIIGDWVPPPSSTSRIYFSAIAGDTGDSKTAQQTSVENPKGVFFVDSKDHTSSENNVSTNSFKFTELGTFSEQKPSSLGGLVERIAARAGFNAPRLNTDNIRSVELSMNPEIRSPYLTIPPGLSPTSLLDSPVFLANSLVTPTTLPKSFPSIDVSVESDNALQSQSRNTLQFPMNLSRSTTQNDSRGNTVETEQRAFDPVCGSAENSPILDEQQVEEGDQRVSAESMVAGGSTASEDGYNWRKYGQKQVKGSECPRSYYKCTHPTCLVRKKVERSLEGHITEIIYKAVHNHPKRTPNGRSSIGNPLLDMQIEQNVPQNGTNNDLVWANVQKGSTDWRQDNIEVTSSAYVAHEHGNPASAHAQTRNLFESGEAFDVSYTFSNDGDEDDQVTHGSVGYDGEGDESESKRRKIETYAMAEMVGATKAIREPRVVVQTTSEVDTLDDGYRWRKYGQKVVKGNPNPRSYYKCTSAGCIVRKHVERASHDLKSVITTYEGKHNHDVPTARNSSHVNTDNSNTTSAQAKANVQRHESSQVHNIPMFDRSSAFGSFGLLGRQQLGPSGFFFGMNQTVNFEMAGLGPGQHKMQHLMPVHPFLSQQHPMSEMGFMLPEGKSKMEPISEHNLNLSNNTSIYQHFMSRLPLGPQM